MSGGDRILVHTCCASCSSYVLEYLSARFEVEAFYYNPNIQPEEEYLARLSEMRKVCDHLSLPLHVGDYEPGRWWAEIEPLRDLPEKSERCWSCYRIRLRATAEMAVELGIKIFTSTLSVSPHKVYRMISDEGARLAEEKGLVFLDEDFKKKDGFRISVESSRRLGLTRQDYCGCILSLDEARKRRADRADKK